MTIGINKKGTAIKIYNGGKQQMTISVKGSDIIFKGVSGTHVCPVWKLGYIKVLNKFLRVIRKNSFEEKIKKEYLYSLNICGNAGIEGYKTCVPFEVAKLLKAA
jgi:hypothetical protein